MSHSGPDPTPAPCQLTLYSRQGCCLCEGLEEKLQALDPPPAVTVIDVDQDPALQARYGLEVPVLVVRQGTAVGAERQLPRVPPRLQGPALQVWLQKNCFVAGSA
jgi:hypothetical protein